MEYADSGDFFNEEDIWLVLLQTLQGLNKLHSMNVMHRDLKSANIFMNKDKTCKLGDMNVSKKAN